MGRDWLPEDFTFVGQRVILNPESSDYQYRKVEQGIEDNSGYVISQEASETDIPIILSNGKTHMPNWSVKVLWNNGKNTVLKVRELLQLNEPIEEVKRYHLRNGHRIDVFNERGQKELDRNVIVKEREIEHITTFNEEYRKKHIAKAYEIMSKES